MKKRKLENNLKHNGTKQLENEEAWTQAKRQAEQVVAPVTKFVDFGAVNDSTSSCCVYDALNDENDFLELSSVQRRSSPIFCEERMESRFSQIHSHR